MKTVTQPIRRRRITNAIWDSALPDYVGLNCDWCGYPMVIGQRRYERAVNGDPSSTVYYCTLECCNADAGAITPESHQRWAPPSGQQP